MKNLMKNKVFKTLISAVLFGLLYSFIIEGNKNWGFTIKITVIYFILLCSFNYIAPKLKKFIDSDKALETPAERSQNNK